MIEYRAFHNSDPPRLVELWHAAELGRGAASGFTTDAFEHVALSQGYFDPRGLIVAVDTDSGMLIGMGHAGFGPDEHRTSISTTTGVICILLVRPEYQQRGIGRELVRRLEKYLHQHGAETILAGPAAPFDPFYVGLYGGSQPSGFLESDPAAAPFFTALGYEPIERFAILQRDLESNRDPINVRVVSIRRKTNLVLVPHEADQSFWWMTRFSRLDTLRFRLASKTDGTSRAEATVVGMELYFPKWQQRVVGVIDLMVPLEARRQGFGQALLLEIGKRLREEFVSRLEAHISEGNAAALQAFRSAGFTQVDAGVVYRKPAE